MKRMQNEEGSALAFVLVVMVVVFLLVAGLITASVSENHQAMYQTDYIKAQYIARAGAESVAMEIIRLSKKDKGQLPNFSTKRYVRPSDFTSELMDGQGELLVSVELDTSTDDDKYIVKSVGSYDGVDATTKLTMSYGPVSELRHVLFGEDLKDLHVQEITGGVGSGNEITFAANKAKNVDSVAWPISFTPPLQKPVFDGELTTPTGTTLKSEHNGTPLKVYLGNNEIDGNNVVTSSGVILGDVSIDTLVIDTSSIVSNGTALYKQEYHGIDHYEAFELSDTQDSNNHIDGSEPFLVLYLPGDIYVKKEIRIEGGNNVMIIVEDRLYLDSGLSITGDENVEIYFLENPSDDDGEYDFSIMKNLIYGKPGSENQLKIYLFGDKVSMQMKTNPEIYGYIISEDADIDIKTGGTTVIGAIYGRNFEMDASVSIISPSGSVVEASNFVEMGIDYWEGSF